MKVQEKLKIFDDSNFSFNEEKHIYSYNGVKMRSVTNFISQFHEPFDEEGMSKRVSEKTGRPQEEILLEWKTKNDKSKTIGSDTHQWIENYFKNVPQKLPSDMETIKRINSFNIAWVNYLHKLEPLALEKRIFHKDWLIAGTIDSLFAWKDKLIIIDFKTNEEFRDDNHQKGTYNKLKDPFGDYWQNHLNDYSIQVSLYSLILEEIAGLTIDKSYLLHISSSGPKMYQAHDFRLQLKDFITKQ
jgi:ATP-dependent exoDNAse (exonuclease V) beta subunit